MIEEKANVDMYINGQQAVKMLQECRKNVQDLEVAWAKAKDASDVALEKTLRKQLNNARAELRKVQSGVNSVEAVMKQLNKATPKDLQRSIQVLTKELNNLERGSSAWNAHMDKIRLLKAELGKVNAEIQQSESVFTRMKNTVNNWGASIAAGAGAVTGLVMAGKKAVNAYAEMQQEEANVRKYTGMTEEQVNRLNEAFKKMDTRTSREALNQLAQEAGRLGKQSEEDVLGFVRAADKINVALDDLGDGATLTLSKLTTIFGDEERLGTEKALLSVGSVINELSQNCTASAPYLAEFAQRLAGVGAQAHMTIPEIMGFGAVLDSQGQKVEMSATALSQVIMKLFKDPAKIAKATGMAVEEFSDTCKRSTNEGLLMLLNRLHEIGGIDSLAPVFADMGENGARASAVLAALAGNIDTVRQQQEAANVAFSEAVSIDKEFEVQNTTVQAGLEKARKGFTEMAVTLGKELMPIVEHLISGTSATMRVMLKTIQFIKENRIALIALTAALSAYYVLAKGQEALNTFVGGVKKAISAIKAFNAALLSNPYAAIGAALVGIGTALALVIKRRNEMSLLEKTEAAAQKEINEQYAEQRAKIDMLNDAVHDETLSMQARQKALEQLKALVPDYHASLTDEGKLINDNADAIDNYTKKLEKQIQMQVYQEKLTDLYRQKMQAEENITNRQADLDEANRKAAENGNKVQMRTSMGAAGPTGGYENSYSVDVKVKTGNLEAAKQQLGDINTAIDAIKGKIKDGDLLEAAPSGGSTPKPEVGNTNAAAPVDVKDRLKALEEAKKKEIALNQIAYLQGEKDFKQYTDGQLQAEVTYQKAKMTLYKEGSTEYLEAQAAMLDAQDKQEKAATGRTVEEEQKRYSETRRILDQRYADGEMSARAYQLATEQAELEHLQNMVNLYKEGSEERIKAQEVYQNKSLQYQRKHAEEAQKMQDKFRKQYFSESSENSNPEMMAYEMQQLELVKNELVLKADTDEEKLKLEEAYQLARYEIAQKYNDEVEMAAIDSAHATFDKITKFMNSKGSKQFQSAFGSIVSAMGNIFSGLTDLINSEVEMQTARIEQKYDAEIAAAGDNAARIGDLESKKQAEIASLKNQASDREFRMKYFSAVADGAMAAISAWNTGMEAGFPAGLVLAPALLALSLVSTGIQIASIKKQQEAAKATGYATGGYTKPGRKYEPAGIVHAGEWVASQELLASPAAAATIAQLDQAQRTNTIGMLDRQQVSASVSAPVAAARSASSSTSERSDGITDALQRLNKRLNEPFVNINTVSGDKGILRAQKRYELLIKNKGK